MNMLRLMIAALFAATAAGCAVGPDYKEARSEVPAGFAANNEAGTGEVDTRWWQRFDDPILNRLIGEGNNNKNLKIASARLLEARANLRLFVYDLFPDGDVSFQYDKTKRSIATILPGDPRTIEFYSAGAQISWELDLAGGIRRSVEAARADYEGKQAGLRDVQVAVNAEIARTYLSLRGAQTRLKLARQNANAQRETLRLTQTLLEAGRGNGLDVARAQSQYDSTSATIPPLETLVAAAIHRLAVLTGRQPQALRVELSVVQPAPVTPLLTDIGTPETLIRRRPDIRVAERALAAFTAQIGVATADLYPHIGFSGSFGSIAPRSSDIGHSQFETYSIVPGIRWALFDLHRVRARIDAADARTQGALAAFELSVLVALEETENALVDYGGQIRRRASLQSNAEAAARAAELARQRYRDGAASFLDMLDAERTLLNAQDQLAQTEQAAGIALVAVYTALGGGWEPAVTRNAN